MEVIPDPVPKRIFVIDDHEILRRGWYQLISAEDDLIICGEAATADDALRAIPETRPDIVVTDISLPGRNGLELVMELKALYPELPVLVVSMHDERIYGERVIKAGGWGYIMKESASEELVVAIRQVLRGHPYLSEALSSQIWQGLRAGSPRFPLDRLTNRELQVFGLIGDGRSQTEIAQELGIVPRTVEAHRTNIRKKLGLADAHALFRYAVRRMDSGNGLP